MPKLSRSAGTALPRLGSLTRDWLLALNEAASSHRKNMIFPKPRWIDDLIEANIEQTVMSESTTSWYKGPGWYRDPEMDRWYLIESLPRHARGFESDPPLPKVQVTCWYSDPRAHLLNSLTAQDHSSVVNDEYFTKYLQAQQKEYNSIARISLLRPALTFFCRWLDALIEAEVRRAPGKQDYPLKNLRRDFRAFIKQLFYFMG